WKRQVRQDRPQRSTLRRNRLSFLFAMRAANGARRSASTSTSARGWPMATSASRRCRSTICPSPAFGRAAPFGCAPTIGCRSICRASASSAAQSPGQAKAMWAGCSTKPSISARRFAASDPRS
ncbi:MAG: hypothetical protein AVDCRST_MAG91-2645, partial [uncultured Sphingomonadaceae bacterium]